MPKRIGDALETDTDHIRSPTLPHEDDDGPDSTQATKDISTPSSQQSKGLKRKRGATKMKNIALNMESQVDVEWTEGGELIREGSVSLSSFLGLLVREIVPVTLVDWRKHSSDISHILWKTIHVTYKVDQEWQKDYIFRAMGRLFRSSKSTLVHQIRQAPNEEERMKICSGNIKKVKHWRQFERGMKTSAKFKAISNKYKAMRSEQIPHTCSQKGMVRLTVVMNVNTNEKKCKLLDWTGSGDIVAVGRWHSSNPKFFVNHTPLGPNAMKILVDISREPEAHLWRSTAEMITIERAIGNIVAWPADEVIINTSQKTGNMKMFLNHR